MGSGHKGFSSLTGEGSASGAFGAYTVDLAVGEGRFGPVFRAHDAAGDPVIVRTFTQAFSSDQQARVMSALEALCRAPLEHPSIARPIACGIAEDGQPYVVHTYLPGTPLSDFITASGRRGVEDVVNRLTYLAGALDFAAAANVVHGALSESDVIFSSESAGVSGLGLVQALESAGIEGFEGRRENDVAALMEIAGQLLGEQSSPAAQSLLSGPVPATALAFAAALHRTLEPPVAGPSLPAPRGHVDRPAGAPPSEAEKPRGAELAFDDPDELLAEPDNGTLVDIQLRHDEQQLEAPLMFRAAAPVAASRSSHWGAWLTVGAVGLALGIAAGFAGGLFAAREAPPPAPVAHTEAPKPEATNGQPFTDAPVDDVAAPPAVSSAPAPAASEPPPRVPESKPRPAKPAAAPPARAAGQPAVTPPSAPSRSGPAAMLVDSRPVGAQVFVDGRSVGYTPLVVGALAPGTHSIRMQLPGYRPWVSAVTLSPGARERVAASLEQ